MIDWISWKLKAGRLEAKNFFWGPEEKVLTELRSRTVRHSFSECLL